MKRLLVLALLTTACPTEPCASPVRDETTASGELHFEAATFGTQRDETFDAVAMTTPVAGGGKYARHVFHFDVPKPPTIAIDVDISVLPDTGATHIDDQNARICAGTNFCESLFGAEIVSTLEETCGGSACSESIDLQIRITSGGPFHGEIRLRMKEHLDYDRCPQ